MWNLPDDLKFFKKITMNSKIVMERKTFESLPGRLKNRLYYIITNNTEFSGSIYKYFLSYVKRMYITEVDKCYLDADCYFQIMIKVNGKGNYYIVIFKME